MELFCRRCFCGLLVMFLMIRKDDVIFHGVMFYCNGHMLLTENFVCQVLIMVSVNFICLTVNIRSAE